MDISDALQECRRFLRMIECDIIPDPTDNNLLEIFIRSEDKKIVLLKWLLQNIYSPEVYHSSSMEDLLQLFFTPTQLNSFLKGKMLHIDQLNKWKLIFQTMKIKITENPDKISVVDKMLSGSLFDKNEEALGRTFKINKRAALLSDRKYSIHLEGQIRKLEEELRIGQGQADLSSIEPTSTLNEFTHHTDNCNINTFIYLNKSLNEKIEEYTLKQSMENSESARTSLTAEKLNNKNLIVIKENLQELSEIMNGNILE